MTTRVGTLTLRVPRHRNGKFSTELFARYQRSEQALLLAMMEMVVNGVSTRKIENITEELCGKKFSKSTVSALCKRLDPVVYAFKTRPLESHYPFLIVDALYLKVREDGGYLLRFHPIDPFVQANAALTMPKPYLIYHADGMPLAP
jgi:putative transposase